MWPCIPPTPPTHARQATDALIQRTTNKPAAAAPSINRILFVENLPPSTNEAMLGMLFQQFTGFKEVSGAGGGGGGGGGG